MSLINEAAIFYLATVSPDTYDDADHDDSHQPQAVRNASTHFELSIETMPLLGKQEVHLRQLTVSRNLKR